MIRIFHLLIMYVRSFLPKNNNISKLFLAISTIVALFAFFMKFGFGLILILYVTLNALVVILFNDNKPFEIELEENFSLNQKVQSLSDEELLKLKKMFMRYMVTTKYYSASQQYSSPFMSKDIYNPIEDLWTRINNDENMTILDILNTVRQINRH